MRLIATQTSLIVAGLFILILAPIALAQPAAADGAEQPLIPCLAVAADGSPVMPGRSLPSSKKLTVAFHLPKDDASKQLKSKWIALDADNQVVAENTLDLKGQKSGWLRLVLKQPAPAGKYRLETMLDDKPWESIDLEVVAPPEEGRAEKPADLIPLDEGKTLNYEMIMRPQPGTKIDMPNSTREPDGTIRSQVSVTFGKPNEVGTQKEISVNGKLAAILWVKVDEQGLRSYRKKEGERVQDINPPWMIYPLPPKLEPGIEWTAKMNDGGEQKLTLFGPMTIDGPGGAATGYMIFAEEDTAHGSPGTEAVRGRDTYERYFVPKVGLVREVQVSTLSGKLTSRRELKLSGGSGGGAYALVADPNMKGRLGRIQCAYPPDTQFAEAHLAIFKGDAKDNDKPMTTGYGEKSFELMPGKYSVSINKKRVPVEVKSGHQTVPRVGVLRVHAGSETHFRVLDSDGTTVLWSGYGEKDVPLPVGHYVLDISGSTEPVKIEDGKVTEF